MSELTKLQATLLKEIALYCKSKKHRRHFPADVAATRDGRTIQSLVNRGLITWSGRGASNPADCYNFGLYTTPKGLEAVEALQEQQKAKKKQRRISAGNHP